VFHILYLISILSQLENRYKIELFLKFSPTMLVFAGAGELHANDPKKAQVQCTSGLKLLKDYSQNAATNHAKANS